MLHSGEVCGRRFQVAKNEKKKKVFFWGDFGWGDFGGILRGFWLRGFRRGDYGWGDFGEGISSPIETISFHSHQISILSCFFPSTVWFGTIFFFSYSLSKECLNLHCNEYPICYIGVCDPKSLSLCKVQEFREVVIKQVSS